MAKVNIIHENLFPVISEEQQDNAEKQIIEQQQIVDYEIKEYTIELLINKFTEGEKENQNEIFIPQYHRKFVWAEETQSEFIESLLLGLPISYMFVAENEDGRCEIIDGTQRIRCLRYFLENELQLIGLKKLDTLNGFRFKDMPYSRQLRFKKKSIRLIQLTAKAKPEIRFDIFNRINKNSSSLSSMEFRKGVYNGKFLDFIDYCASNARFHILCPVIGKRNEQEERTEMVLRFFAYSENYQNFVHTVNDFLDTYTKEKNKTGFDESLLDNEFENMLDFVEKYFPYGFRKTENHNSTARVRFEAIAIGVNLALKENPSLMNPNMDWLNSKEFEEHVTSDTANNRNKVLGRIEFVRDKLLGKI
jgi:hypothetical protein